MAAKIVQVLAFMLAISTALALTCYKCDSSENKLCSYGISSFTYNTVDCNEEFGGGALTSWIPKQCVKLVAQDKDGNEHIARGCMPHTGGACSSIAKALSFFSSVEGDIKDMNCYPCDSDKCNSAPKLTYTFLGVIMAAVVFMLM
ncbi:hypothetical protein Zmor_023376 [Zophobas morio]|uniref:Protein quiver n=1 Tax=Zophobas morio TaxID=2755281 RepID=A0AA38M6B8_9CUCU|nr:hypothetical protein Zmor_023376 [Zophobas morio]